MDRLSRSDLEALVKFLAEVAEFDSTDAYAPCVLRRLQQLIPCGAMTYQEYSYRARRHLLLAGFEPNGEEFCDAPGVDDPEEDLYWRAGPCAIVEYRAQRHDLEALRMSDVLAPRRFHSLPLYADYFRPSGVEYLLDLGLEPRESRERSLCLLRSKDERDFTARDCSVLELLRPHLAQRERIAALRARLAEAVRAGWHEQTAHLSDALTAREREIVTLVGEGKTNAEIAAQLWIAPSTVKKHLENVYAKVGVGRRAGAVARLRSAP